MTDPPLDPAAASDAASPDAAPLTRRLLDVPDGEKIPAERLLPLLYEELRRLARAQMARERPGPTLQATLLVHEAYLRLVGERDPGWNGRGHFFGAAARAMRRILVEQARARGRLKRGGDRDRVPFEEAALPIEAPVHDVLAVDELLERIEAEDPRKARLVELRFFAGLSNEESAAALGVSVKTVEREWRFLRAWLREELGDAVPQEPTPRTPARGGDPADPKPRDATPRDPPPERAG